MSAFQYTALDKKGKTITGIKQGDSARQVRQLLRQSGLNPLTIEALNDAQHASPAKPASTPRGFSFSKMNASRYRLTLPERALVTRQLATLVAAGVTIEETLQGVCEQSEKASVKTILSGIRASVMEGFSLADAMRVFPFAFPEMYCASVGAGEQTGRLDLVLIRLADYSERQQAIRQKIHQALIYPAMMTTVSLGIVSFLLIFVVPKIIDVFKSTGQSLPQLTKILISLSANTKAYGLYFIIGFIIALFVFRHAIKNNAVRTRWHHVLLRLPGIGYAIRTTNTARYSRTLGILSSAGVSVLEAMRIAATLITNLPMQTAITEAASRVREGSNIHKSLKQTDYFTPMAIHLIANGEASGKLDEMLARTADTQENELTRLIDTGLRLFEPMMILTMGVVVLFIVLAILLPIFELDQF